PLHSIPSSFTHSFNFFNLEGDDLTNLTAFRMLEMDSCLSFNPSFTIKLTMWAQHLKCKNLPPSMRPSFLLENFFCKYLTALLLVAALSTVMVNNLEMPQSLRQASTSLPIVSLLWSVIWQKLMILFCKHQSLSIQ
ncbi:hypothetical protein TorRG33x02_060780, partial [Trema orientale]